MGIRRTIPPGYPLHPDRDPSWLRPSGARPSYGGTREDNLSDQQLQLSTVRGRGAGQALAQTVPFDEIIVVDDGSTDGSLHWLQSTYGACRSVRLFGQKNQGQLSCFNEGFRRSRGDLVFFLDADDLYEPEYVERVLAFYERDPEIDVVLAGFQWHGTDARPQPRSGNQRRSGLQRGRHAGVTSVGRSPHVLPLDAPLGPG